MVVKKLVGYNERGELKNLNIEPLYIAKFFYDKGVEDIAIIQRLIYLVYYEVLEKENLLLFAEEWQAWSGGAVLESVFYKMRGQLDRKELFKQIPPLSSSDEKVVIGYCKNIFKDYQEYVEVNEEYKFFQKARNKPWEMVRHNLSSDLEKDKIKTTDIVNFINMEKSVLLLHSLLKKLLEVWMFGRYLTPHQKWVNFKHVEKVTALWATQKQQNLIYE